MKGKVDSAPPAERRAAGIEGPRRARVSLRSVFPVDGARLAIGQFNRPLADTECRVLRSAWERRRLPGVEDFEVTRLQVSFVTPPRTVDATWRSIDALLASPSQHATS